MNQPDIHRLLEFQKLLLDFAHIERVLKRKHHGKYIRENDTEHSYNLAMTAWFICEYFPELDQLTVIKTALVHDLVEVHAGDTYIYADQATLATKAEREAAALERLKEEWADFPDMLLSIENYEHRDTPEARFVYALDKLMPMMLIYGNEGKTWQEEGITVKKLHTAKQQKVAVSPEINPYYEKMYELLLASPDLIKPE